MGPQRTARRSQPTRRSARNATAGPSSDQDPLAAAPVAPPRRRQAPRSAAPPLPTPSASEEDKARAEAVRRESEARMAIEQARMAIEQANAEALRARQDRIAEAEIEAIRNGRYAEASSGEPGNTDDSGEISLPIDNALQGLYKKFPGLKRDLIKSIRHSKFIPRMLFKLRYAQGVNTDRRTQEVLIKDGKIEVVAKDYLKDYGRTSSIWTEGFVNYAAILVEFFGAEFPGLHIALSRFMLDVIELEKIYDWQTAVLPLALQFHEELADDGLCSDPSRWTLDRQYVDRFCNATRLKSVHPNQPLADKVPKGPSQRQHPLEPNDSSVICRKWNTPESCRWPGCRRRHEKFPAGHHQAATK
jgi:hypothetical protein